MLYLYYILYISYSIERLSPSLSHIYGLRNHPRLMSHSFIPCRFQNIPTTTFIRTAITFHSLITCHSRITWHALITFHSLITWHSLQNDPPGILHKYSPVCFQMTPRDA